MASNGSDVNAAEVPAGRPVIGLTTYLETATCLVWEAEFALLHQTYVDMVVQAGGVPVLLPPVPDAADRAGRRAGRAGADRRLGRRPGAATARQRHELTGAGRSGTTAEVGLLRCRARPGHPAARRLPRRPADERRARRHADPAPARLARDTAGTRRRPGCSGRTGSGWPRAAGWPGSSAPTAEVRCHHHQALDRVADELTVVGWSEDGTIEAVEIPERRFAIGVQWHPEQDATDKRLFAALIEAARGARRTPMTVGAVINPATGRVVRDVPVLDVEQTDAAIERAVAAGPWLARGEPGRPGPAAAPVRRGGGRRPGAPRATRGAQLRAPDRRRALGGRQRPRRARLLRGARPSGCSDARSRWPAGSTSRSPSRSAWSA